jgi:ATP-dependent helicase HrpB
VLPLHGELPPAEQDRALAPSDRRKVVLATSIAETSLTVPGVRIVVDGGFRRAPRLDPASGLTRLVTVRISRAAAEQRAGRAGRTAPGVAIRLWSEAVHRGLPQQDRPEILEAELSGLALDIAAWGAAPPDLAFLDPPPAGAMAAARALLADLEALDGEGRITATGAAHGPPRHASAARAHAAGGGGRGRGGDGRDLAALLEERDPIRDREAPSDIRLRLDLLHGGDHPNLDRGAIQRIRRAAALHRRRLGVHGNTPPEGEAGALLAAGFPDRIAAKRGTMDGAFRLASGQGARLPATDPLGRSPLLAVADLALQGTEARIRMAAPLDRARLEARFPDRLRREQGAPSTRARMPSSRATGCASGHWCWRSGSCRARRRRRPPPRSPPPSPSGTCRRWTGPSRRGRRGRGSPSCTAWSPTPGRTCPTRPSRPGCRTGSPPGCTARRGWWRRGRSTSSPCCARWCRMRRRGGWMPELPARVELPGGRSAAIDYTGERPTLEARAQHLFGLAALPPLAGGRVPLQVALLSPAGRPVAVTGDLAGFWRGAWAEVRKEMRGRYPRHDWPEDPSRPG